jgi:hypothetical protein
MGFKVEWADDLDDDDPVFDTEEEAEEHASVVISNYHTGGEVLHLSNPGDYPEPDGEDPEYEIVEV